MKGFVSLQLLLSLLVAGCAPVSTLTIVPTQTVAPATETATVVPSATPEPRTLTVFAAASLTDAFKEIGANFEAAHAGVTVAFNFAGSQTLRTQLEQGASADVFASANHAEMENAIKSSLIQQAGGQDFLTNKLVVVMPKNNPANIQTLQDLARSGVKVVLAADTVPAGKYARQILDKMSQDAAFGTDFSAKVLANVVSNETDVKQVVAKVQLGEADAGIVYISDSIAAPDLKTIVIPDNLNVIAKYPIADLDKASNPDLAAEFIAYVLSPEGQAILKKWGFTPLA